MKLPRVTTIIKDAGLMPWMPENQAAMDKGSKIHRAIHYWCEGDLDEDDIDPVIAGHLESFKAALSVLEWNVLHSELRIESAHGYRGTLDLILVDKPGNRILADIKTGQPAAWHAIQVALYTLAYEEQTGDRIKKRFSIYTKESGAAAATPEHKDRKDFVTARAAVTIHRWRLDHGLLE